MIGRLIDWIYDRIHKTPRQKMEALIKELMYEGMDHYDIQVLLEQVFKEVTDARTKRKVA